MRRGAPPGRTGRRPRRPSRRTQRGSAENRRTAVSSSSRDAARWSPRSRTPRTCRSATAGTTSPRRSGTTRSSSSRETGSGKTTQLPKICSSWAAASRDHRAHAASPDRRPAVAERIAEELGVDLGEAVGYQVRFADHSSRDTLVKVMTDGILLAELQRDRDLRRYDTIIIDEAHERSLNVDFLRVPLRGCCPAAPTSRSSSPRRPSTRSGSPTTSRRWAVRSFVVEVSGRTYPVEVRYRPLEHEEGAEPVDQVTGIVEAVEAVDRVAGDGGSQDILVFLSGEREIRDAAEALTALNLPATGVLPLFGRLSAAEHRVFGRHDGRRIVLSTNVAETSLTVPGIRYVVDTGTARISRYSQRTKVQRLPIEPISQASANQRAGRCGRLADGICIRLYAEEDYLEAAGVHRPRDPAGQPRRRSSCR